MTCKLGRAVRAELREEKYNALKPKIKIIVKILIIGFMVGVFIFLY